MPNRRNDKDSICKRRADPRNDARRQEGRKDRETTVRHAFNILDVYAYSFHQRELVQITRTSAGCFRTLEPFQYRVAHYAKLDVLNSTAGVCAEEVCTLGKSEAGSKEERGRRQRERERRGREREKLAIGQMRRNLHLDYEIGFRMDLLVSAKIFTVVPYAPKVTAAIEVWGKFAMLAGGRAFCGRNGGSEVVPFCFFWVDGNERRRRGEENWILQFHTVSSALRYTRSLSAEYTKTGGTPFSWLSSKITERNRSRPYRR